jgi:hypothetical protein
MSLFRRCAWSLALLAFLSAGAASAAPGVEGTPAPIPPKPNWSSMNFLIGTWTCTDLSSRRPGPFTTTQVYTMDPSGYWMMREDTIHTASWIKTEVHTHYKYTWDTYAHRWVRIGTGDFGGYSVATAPMPVGKMKTYTFVIQAKSPDVSWYAPEVYTVVGTTKKMMTTSFRENGGRVVNVKETCIKNGPAM